MIRRFKIKNKLVNPYYAKGRFFFKKEKLKKYSYSWLVYNFNSYLSVNNLFKKNKICKRYIKFYDKIKIIFYTLRLMYPEIFENTFYVNSKLIFNFIKSYCFFFNARNVDMFYIFKKRYKTFFFYLYLNLTFKNYKFHINLLNSEKKNYLSLNSGPFLKFFKKKKSFRKTKTIKLLMAKFMRKLLLLANITTLILTVNQVPLFLNEIINFFNQSIIHKFLNPFTNKFVDESVFQYRYIKFIYYIFRRNVSFVKYKSKHAARVKRKIRRKLILLDKVID